MIILLIIIYFLYICFGIQSPLLGAAWPSMYDALILPITYAGIISIIIKGGTIISSLFAGNVLNRYGSGKIILVGFLCIASSLYGFSVSDSMFSLCASAVPLGIGVGLEQVALNDFVSIHFKARQMFWLHSCWGIGATIGPIIISFSLMNTGAWRAGYNILSIAEFCIAGVVLLTLPLWRKVTTNDNQIKSNINKNVGIIQLLKTKGVQYALMSFFFYTSTETSFILWGSSFLVITKQIPVETAASWVSIYFIGITLGRLVSGFLATLLSNRQQIRLGQLFIVFGILFLLLPLGNVLTQISFLLMGLGCAPIFPSLSHDTPRNFGKEYSQAILGLQVAFAYIGATVTPSLFGYIASMFNDNHGYNIFPVFLLLNLFMMFIATEMLNRKTIIKYL